jgi:hypothetical protein
LRRSDFVPLQLKSGRFVRSGPGVAEAFDILLKEKLIRIEETVEPVLH